MLYLTFFEQQTINRRQWLSNSRANSGFPNNAFQLLPSHKNSDSYDQFYIFISTEDELFKKMFDLYRNLNQNKAFN